MSDTVIHALYRHKPDETVENYVTLYFENDTNDVMIVASDCGLGETFTGTSLSEALTFIKQVIDTKLQSADYTQATTTVAGKMKLYTTTGTATDGTITQKAITDALGTKVNTDTKATASTFGIAKLYTTTNGTNADGSVTQAAIKSSLDTKLDSASYTQATTTVAGKMKLYTTTGTATDGTITQKAITDALEEITGELTDGFVGATSSTDGKAGAVPGPKAGEEGYVLFGDGNWGRNIQSYMGLKLKTSEGYSEIIPASTLALPNINKESSYIGMKLKARTTFYSEIIPASAITSDSNSKPHIGIYLKASNGYTEIYPATSRNPIGIQLLVNGSYTRI